ncbi:MAG: L-threonylcarbamoyladenylate synthase [Acidiferrobacter sp.]
MTLSKSVSEQIMRAAQILRHGGLVAFPTETVYGLGADARNAEAVRRIFRAKARPADHPLIVHLSDIGEMERWAQDIPAVAWRLAGRFWPGPLTLILKRAVHVLDEVTGGQDTIGLRVPWHPVALALLKAFGDGLAAPSANPFGGVSPTTAAHVTAGLGHAVGAVINGGPCAVGLESTILDLSGTRPRLLRPGAVTSGALAETLGAPVVTQTMGAPRAPGCLPSHYAPNTPLRLVTSAIPELERLPQPLAVMAMRSPKTVIAGHRWVTMPRDASAYGRALYARLREIDSWGCRCILVELPPATMEWEAVRDRLGRAAGADKYQLELT